MLDKIVYKGQENIKKEVSSLLVEAFPRDERPPEEDFFASLEKKENKLIAYYDNEKFIGFSFLTIYQDVCYIFFLAISPTYRHLGYGGQVLEYIKKEYQDYVLLLCYEEVNPQYPNYLVRVNREKFYLSHGFTNNHMKTNEFGVIYQTAYIGKRQVSFNEYLEVFKLGFGEDKAKYLKEAK